VQVEERLDATIHMRFQGQYLRIRRCAEPLKPLVLTDDTPTPPVRKPRQKSDWMKNFFQQPGPSLGKAIRISHGRS